MRIVTKIRGVVASSQADGFVGQNEAPERMPAETVLCTLLADSTLRNDLGGRIVPAQGLLTLLLQMVF